MKRILHGSRIIVSTDHETSQVDESEKIARLQSDPQFAHELSHLMVKQSTPFGYLVSSAEFRMANHLRQMDALGVDSKLISAQKIPFSFAGRLHLSLSLLQRFSPAKVLRMTRHLREIADAHTVFDFLFSKGEARSRIQTKQAFLRFVKVGSESIKKHLLRLLGHKELGANALVRRQMARDYDERTRKVPPDLSQSSGAIRSLRPVLANSSWETDHSSSFDVSKDQLSFPHFCPSVDFRGRKVLLTGGHLFEGLAVLTEIWHAIGSKSDTCSIYSRYRNQVPYCIAIESALMIMGSNLSFQDLCKLETRMEFLEAVTPIVSAILFAFHLPVSLSAKGAAEMRFGEFWSISPLDIHPGVRFLRALNRIRQVSQDAPDMVQENENRDWRENTDRYVRILDSIGFLHGEAPLFDAFMSSLYISFEDHNYKWATDARSTQHGHPVLKFLLHTSGEFNQIVNNIVIGALAVENYMDLCVAIADKDGLRMIQEKPKMWEDTVLTEANYLYYLNQLHDLPPSYLGIVERYVESARAELEQHQASEES